MYNSSHLNMIESLSPLEFDLGYVHLFGILV